MVDYRGGVEGTVLGKCLLSVHIPISTFSIHPYSPFSPATQICFQESQGAQCRIDGVSVHSRIHLSRPLKSEWGRPSPGGWGRWPPVACTWKPLGLTITTGVAGITGALNQADPGQATAQTHSWPWRRLGLMMAQTRTPPVLCPLPQPSNVCRTPLRPPPEASGCVGMWACQWS